MSGLRCSRATPTILLGFLLPWACGISSRLLQQSAAAAPYLGRGISLLRLSPLQHHAATACRSSSFTLSNKQNLSLSTVEVCRFFCLNCQALGAVVPLQGILKERTSGQQMFPAAASVLPQYSLTGRLATSSKAPGWLSQTVTKSKLSLLAA